MKFSVIVVCLNSGEKLKATLESILGQDYSDFEVVIKDGGSTDGSLNELPKDNRIRLYTTQDTGIYDAMNQGVSYATGEYLIFMNCGDSFYDSDVLTRIAEVIAVYKPGDRLLLYGDIFNDKTQSMIVPSPKIDGFTCYRNVPCHQSCIYAASLCKEKPYEPKYRIRADYEHFLWCFYRGHAKTVYLGTVVAHYEGGGFSETRENLKLSRKEHKEITAKYMSKRELFCYRMILLLTLQPIRTKMAESKSFSNFYHKVTGAIYGKRKSRR